LAKYRAFNCWRIELFFPFIAIIFLAYEIAEFIIVREDKTCFIGDFVEFCIGYTVIGLFYQLFGVVMLYGG
jgi:hypothetical protein